MQSSCALLVTGQMLVLALLQLLVAGLRPRRRSVPVQRPWMWHRVSVIVVNQFMRCESGASAVHATVVWKVNWIRIFQFRIHQRWRRLNDRRWRRGSFIRCDCIWLVWFILQWHVRNRWQVSAERRVWMQCWRWQNTRFVSEALAIHLVFLLCNWLAIGVQHSVVEAIVIWTGELAAVNRKSCWKNSNRKFYLTLTNDILGLSHFQLHSTRHPTKRRRVLIPSSWQHCRWKHPIGLRMCAEMSSPMIQSRTTNLFACGCPATPDSAAHLDRATTSSCHFGRAFSWCTCLWSDKNWIVLITKWITCREVCLIRHSLVSTWCVPSRVKVDSIVQSSLLSSLLFTS